MPQTMIDVFSGDAFSSVTLTDLVNRNYPYYPSFLDGLNLAPAVGMLTLDAAFDTSTGAIRMLSAIPRGGPPSQSAYDARSMRRLRASHFAREIEVNADELLGLRAADTLDAETLQGLILQRTDGPTGLKVQWAATREHHLLGMIDGVVYDADNATVLYDFYRWTETERPAPVNIAFAGMTAETSRIRTAATTLKRDAIKALNGMPLGAAQMMVLAGDDLYDRIDSSPEVKDARKTGAVGNRDSIRLLSETRVYDAFDYANIIWVNYRGSDDSLVAVPPNQGRAFMQGVPGLFQTLFAPADTFETVSVVGRPLYLLNNPSRQTEKRAVFELQSNPLHACTRPQSLRRVTFTG